MDLYLEVIEGPDRGKKVGLAGGRSYVIGRSREQCEFALSGDEISRTHARVTIDARGLVWIEDLGSTAGTVVNGKEIREAVPLEPGDSFRIGGALIRLAAAPSDSGSADTYNSLSPPDLRISIGRDPQNNLVIPDPQVSRRHALIECRSGICFLEDLNSNLGTMLDGRPVSGRMLLPVVSWVQIQGNNYLFDGNRLLNEDGSVAASGYRYPDSGSFSPGRALLAPFRGKEILKWLLGSIFSVIPVLDFLACGFRYRLLQNGSKGSMTLPEWDNWGRLFVKGLLYFLVRAVYLALPFSFSLFIILSIRFSLAFVYPLLDLLMLANLLLYALVGFFIPMALAHFAAQGVFWEAFHFRTILGRIGAVKKHYLKVVAVAAGLWVLVSLLALIPYVGFVVGVLGFFYASMVSALLFGEAYGSATRL